jgi:hypothetical protein
METKKYSSYAEIDRELEILKLEKEISYQKIILNIDKTKEFIYPSSIILKIQKYYTKLIPYETILKIALPYIINWFVNKKRGD